MHEQNPTTYDVWTHQQDYVPQVNEIPVDAKALVPDEHPADDDMTQLFMSSVGAMTWLIMTMPCICIYVAFLQRQTQTPNLGHIRRANRLLRWIRRNKSRLGIWFCRQQPPLRVVTLPVSASMAQDCKGLVMRGCVIVLAEHRATDSTPQGVACLKPGQEGSMPSLRVACTNTFSSGPFHIRRRASQPTRRCRTGQHDCHSAR